MRYVVLFSIFLLAFPSIKAQESIKWHSLQEAIELNSEEPRKFIIDVYTDWCGWCKRMDATTFSDPKVAEYVNSNFYAVKFNAEMRDSLQLGTRMYYYVPSGNRGYHEVAAILTKGRLSYPTIVYLDEELRHIEVEPGYRTADQLLPRLIFYHEEHYKAGNVPM